MNLKSRHIRAALCCCLFLVTGTDYCFSQTTRQLSLSQLQIHFLKDSIELEENSFQFNNITLLYTGSNSINAEVQLKAPPFVSIVSPLVTTLHVLGPNQQKLIPVRFLTVPQQSFKGWTAITLLTTIKETGETIEKVFWIKLKPYSRWRTHLLQSDLFVQQTEDKAKFSVLLENMGTLTDVYTVFVETDLAIENGKKTQSVTLAPGELKHLEFIAPLYAFAQERVSSKSLMVHIKNAKGDEKVLRQNISIIGHEYQQNEFAWKRLPLSLELYSQKTGFGTSVFTAALQGTIALSDNQKIAVNAQINNLNRGMQFGNIYAAQYESNRWRIKAGSIVDFKHFIINGTGADVAIKGKNNLIEMAAIKSRVGDIRQLTFAYDHQVKRNLTIHTDVLSNQDRTKKSNSKLTVNKISWAVSKATTLKFESGYGIEQINKEKLDTLIGGKMLGYQAETNWKNISLSSQATYYNKNFPGFNRGFQFQNHEINKTINRFSFGAYYQINEKAFTYTEDTLLSKLLNISTRNAGLRTGLNAKGFMLSLSSGMERQQQDSATAFVTKTWKTSAHLFWAVSSDINFSVFSNAGFVHLPDQPGIKPFWAFNNFGSLYSKKMGINFQANYGPYYYFEVKEFLQGSKEFYRLQLSPYYEFESKKHRLVNRVQLTYNHELPNNFDNLFLVNQLLFSPAKLKTDIAFLTNYNFSNRMSSFANLSVRKKINLPIFKNNASNNFTVVIYKDKNNNGIYNPSSDEIIPDALLSANESLLQTDKNGEVKFKNIGKTAIAIDLGMINHLRGWIPKDGYKQSLLPIKNDEKIYLPFKKSKIVTGLLALTADNKSALRMDLGNIRVTATDDKQNTYHTLTNDQGGFFFNLPSGHYMISINGAVFDENFKPTEITKTADLMNNESIQLTYEIRQKKRQINIQRSPN